jgi:DNA-binding response OmpR family regulator
VKILIVEDEFEVADLLRDVLEARGGRCMLAGNAWEADRLLAESAVDAVTLDLGLPGPGGLEWLERVAVEQPELARRTLVITGQELEPKLALRLARCGAGILAKPFTIENLGDAVRGQLEHSSHDPRN